MGPTPIYGGAILITGMSGLNGGSIGSIPETSVISSILWGKYLVSLIMYLSTISLSVLNSGSISLYIKPAPWYCDKSKLVFEWLDIIKNALEIKKGKVDNSKIMLLTYVFISYFNIQKII